MNTSEISRRMLERSRLILEEAEHLRQKGAWNLVVRRAQEAVELALKATLLWAGLQVPRVHDLGPILRRDADRSPDAFRRQIPRLAEVSRSLRAEREVSFYGDEESGLPPESLYTPEDADRALAQAGEVLDACVRLIEVQGET